MRAKGLILLFLVLSARVFSQNTKIDSLSNAAAQAKQDTNLVKTYMRLCRACFSEKKYTGGFEALKKAHALSSKLNFKRGIFWALESLAINYQAILNMPDSSIKYCDLLVKAGNTYNNYKETWLGYLVAGDAHSAKGAFARAAEAAINALNVAEKNNYTEGMAAAHKGIGVANAYLSDYNTAVKEYNLARDIYLTTGDTANADGLLYVLGIAYGQLHDGNKALECFLKALALVKKEKDEGSIHRLNNEIAGIYSDNGEYNKALLYVLDSYKYFKSTGDKEAIANTCVKVVGYLHALNRHKDKLPYLEEMYRISVEIKSAPHQTGAANAYAGYYEGIGDYKSACLYHNRHKQLRDSLFHSKFTEQVAEMTKKYETERKDKELLKKEAEIKLQQADAGRKSAQRNFFIVGFGLMFLSTFLVLRGYFQKKKANITITLQKKEVEEQKQLVEEKQKEVMDSIRYAKRIQKSLITSEKYIHKTIERLKNS